jgi:capsular exopolysaccharide synthesis family protein
LRTNIQFSAIDEELRTIMVTSAGPSEGKTTTIVNLAITYAQAEKKVVLVDADLRKPTLHHTFGVSNRLGLTSVLAGQSQLADVVKSSDVPRLDLLTSGPIPPNPSEILASKRMNALLEQLSQEYDTVLIDSPPALAVTDAQIISTRCDGVLLVVDSGKVKREAAMKAKANLEHVQARILGVVLNNIDRRHGEAYYYYYYRQEEE